MSVKLYHPLADTDCTCGHACFATHSKSSNLFSSKQNDAPIARSIDDWPHFSTTHEPRWPCTWKFLYTAQAYLHQGAEIPRNRGDQRVVSVNEGWGQVHVMYAGTRMQVRHWRLSFAYISDLIMHSRWTIAPMSTVCQITERNSDRYRTCMVLEFR